MNLPRLMRQAAERANQSVRLAVRGILQRLDATRKLPSADVSGLAGEAIAAELMQHYGLASAPLAGAEVIALPIGGASRHAVVIASIDGRYRISLQPGEVAIHTHEGDHIHLRQGRVIEIVTDTLLVKASQKVRLETPRVEITGDAHADGQVSDGTRSMQGDRDIYNSHKHPVAGSTANPTGQTQ